MSWDGEGSRGWMVWMSLKLVLVVVVRMVVCCASSVGVRVRIMRWWVERWILGLDDIWLFEVVLLLLLFLLRVHLCVFGPWFLSVFSLVAGLLAMVCWCSGWREY